MTVQEYKQRLLDLEKRLSHHISDEREQAREQVLDSPRDAADDSVADEDESVDFAVAELDTTALEQIRDALSADRGRNIRALRRQRRADRTQTARGRSVDAVLPETPE